MFYKVIKDFQLFKLYSFSYGLVTPLNLINVWLNCFTSLPNWQNTSVVYLLNNILRVAYQFPDARLQAIEFFRNYYKVSKLN